MQASPRKVYTTHDAAKRCGVHPSSLIQAEEEGRIPTARRDELGHRIYDERELERLERMIGR